MQILIAIDGKPHSQLALQFAQQLAELFALQATLLFVVSPNEDRAKGQKTLQKAMQGLLDCTGITAVNTLIRTGSPAQEIAQEANQTAYQLLILGQKPAPNLFSRIMGQTALDIITHTHIPIVIAKGPIAPPYHILLCDSGAPGSPLLTHFSQKMRAILTPQTHITVLHVMSQMSAGPGISGKPLRATTEELIQEHTPEGELLQHDLAEFQKLGLKTEAVVRHGLVLDEIVAEAHDGRYDLVVIGANLNAGWQKLILADIASEIVLYLDRPILIVH